MLETAPVVDHHDLGARAAERCAELLQQHRLARARLAADRDIVIAGSVFEWRPEEGLAAAADEQAVRDYAAALFDHHPRGQERRVLHLGPSPRQPPPYIRIAT